MQVAWQWRTVICRAGAMARGLLVPNHVPWKHAAGDIEHCEGDGMKRIVAGYDRSISREQEVKCPGLQLATASVRACTSSSFYL